MSVVPFFAGRAWRSSPLAVFADLQQEYVTPGRAFAVEDTQECLGNCRRWLDHARAVKLPIAHFRQVKREAHFNRTSPFSDWIDGFTPRTSEMLYERAQPSCYANEDFDAFLKHIPSPLIVVAGLSADQACLATVVDAHRRGHRAVVVSDCTATPAFGALSEAASHEAVCHVIARYADVVTLDQLLDQVLSISSGRSIA